MIKIDRPPVPIPETKIIATDLVGTPRILLRSDGQILTQPFRTPFGALIEKPLQDDPNWIPFGFQGGIEDPESGVVILDGKPYDSHLGQWMVPLLERVLDPSFEDPTSIHLYRFANNDPINPGTNAIKLLCCCLMIVTILAYDKSQLVIRLRLVAIASYYRTSAVTSAANLYSFEPVSIVI